MHFAKITLVNETMIEEAPVSIKEVLYKLEWNN